MTYLNDPRRAVPRISFIERIRAFNEEVVGVEPPATPTPLSMQEASWLENALAEEAMELSEASDCTLHDDILVAQVDACVDSIIFAVGGLVRAGLTTKQIEECIHVVMDANFGKKAGVKPGRTGAKDAVKPHGWVGPEDRIKEVLKNG